MSKPKVFIKDLGRELLDHKMYGWRDFLVVSCDTSNDASPTCTIVPISSQVNKNLPTHVRFSYLGTSLIVMCEHIYTVNTAELTRYRYFVKDHIMDKVENALMVHLGIEKKHRYIDEPTVSSSFEKIEEIISGIISSKVQEVTEQLQSETRRVSEREIEDAVLRLGQGLEDVFSVALNNAKKSADIIPNSTSTLIQEDMSSDSAESISESEESSITDDIAVDDSKDTSEDMETVQTIVQELGTPDKNDRVFTEESVQGSEVVETPVESVENSDSTIESETSHGVENTPTEKQEKKPRNPIKKGKEAPTPIPSKENTKRKKRKWTLEEMEEFLDDCEKLPPTRCLIKWQIENMRSFYSMKYYCKSKIEKKI
jgi:mRNA-degrading endonuclease toxin of MazEF toxin-antitoxin module